MSFLQIQESLKFTKHVWHCQQHQKGFLKTFVLSIVGIIPKEKKVTILV
jgi:hypothetical protein